MRPRFALIASLSCLAACRDGTASGPAVGTAAPAETASEAALSPAPPPRDEPAIPMPGPARRRLLAAVLENAACEGCHDEEARAWRGSYHRRAAVDPAFQRAFALEPSPFCRSCHAPEAEPTKEPPGAVSAMGVGCVTCHVTEAGVVLAAARPAGEPTPEAPHPLRRSLAFAGDGGCAGCHEFRFPMPGAPDDDELFMQTTAREHRRSPAAARPCAACHMPTTNGRRSHAFAEVRDPAFLRANLEARAERAAGSTLRVTLVQPNPGHDFPTGDLFRRLEVGVALEGADGTVLHREARYLARHFEIVPGRPGRSLARDDRVSSAPRVVELPFSPPGGGPLPGGARLSWWVTYERVATVGTGTNPAEAVVESRVDLHSGSLPASDNGAPGP